MTFSEYIHKTDLTVVYPETIEMDYLIHGIVDEAGELLEKIEGFESQDLEQRIRQQAVMEGSVDFMWSFNDGVEVDGALKEISKELGDVLWYVARFIKAKPSLSHDFWISGDFKTILQEAPTVPIQDLQWVATGLLIHASKINGYRKKELRDEDNYDEQYESALKFVLQACNTIISSVGLSLSYAMERNISKLLDRGERGVIRGNGDDR